MRFWLHSFFIFNFAFLTIECGLDVEDPTPPSAPVWVQKSLPEEWPELGIDAHESGGIILEWRANPLNENVGVYQVFRAEYFDLEDSLGTFTHLRSIYHESNLNHKYTDTSVQLYITYFYSLRAIDNSGNVSEFSDTLFYTLLEPQNIEMMLPNGTTLPITRCLTWIGGWSIPFEKWTITIVTQNGKLVLRDTFLPHNYLGEEEVFEIGNDIDLHSNMTYQWRVDIEAQYIGLEESAASESKWANFLYIDP